MRHPSIPMRRNEREISFRARAREGGFYIGLGGLGIYSDCHSLDSWVPFLSCWENVIL